MVSGLNSIMFINPFIHIICSKKHNLLIVDQLRKLHLVYYAMEIPNTRIKTILFTKIVKTSILILGRV